MGFEQVAGVETFVPWACSVIVAFILGWVIRGALGRMP